MNYPIRVLQVVSIMNYGGLENFIMNVYRNIDRDKIQFDFLVNKEGKGKFDDEIISMGGRIYKISSFSPYNYFSYVKKLDAFFKQMNYGVIHSHINSSSAIVLAVAKKNNIKIRISHSHIDREGGNYKFLKKILKNFVNKNATIKLACDEDAGKWLFKKNFNVVRNAIDTTKFEFDKLKADSVKKILNINSGELSFIHVGRFDPQKNHKFLIELFEDLVKYNKSFKLFLVGEGQLKNQIINLVKEKKLENNVFFLGARNDVHILLQGMDYFLMPSLYEGLPITLIEAQASGIRIFASNTISKNVNLTNNMFFLDINDKESFIKCIIDNLKYERYNTKELLVDKNYDIKDLVNYLEKIYLS